MQRTATVTRETGETQITLTLNLDGSGKCDVKNPIGFFDHMLRSFCKHGLFDLSGSIAGDLNVDQHHTIEDTGIVLGQCFAKALGDCAGIYRSGCFLYPMDESLCRAAVDFGGRPFLVCEAGLTGVPLV
ncbi:MAG: imidazoleglycerol-phosphate dehydratase, partial [Treponema sp.]|nr:imidazoleglycerol-phosphate dehydratase [Treponema sp.]